MLKFKKHDKDKSEKDEGSSRRPRRDDDDDNTGRESERRSRRPRSRSSSPRRRSSSPRRHRHRSRSPRRERRRSGSRERRNRPARPDKQPKEEKPARAPKPTPQYNLIEVEVNDRLGKKARVKCSPKDTIGDFKKLVAAQIGTDPHKIVLKKWYKEYKDHITLEDYEIHNGINLELYYR